MLPLHTLQSTTVCTYVWGWRAEKMLRDQYYNFRFNPRATETLHVLILPLTDFFPNWMTAFLSQYLFNKT